MASNRCFLLLGCVIYSALQKYKFPLVIRPVITQAETFGGLALLDIHNAYHFKDFFYCDIN